MVQKHIEYITSRIQQLCIYWFGLIEGDQRSGLQVLQVSQGKRRP